MSIPDNYADVVDILLHKTLAKEVLWEPTTDANVFIVSLEASSIALRQYTRDAIISLSILNDKGERIDGFGVSNEEGLAWEIMSELFSVVRRSALAIDDTIQGILAELNKKGTVGKKQEDIHF
jgi:hypothetical protein